MKFNEKAYQAAYREKHREYNRLYQKEYRANNAQMIKEKRRKSYLLKREQKIQATLDWQKNNKGLANAKNKKYKTAKLNRTPKWLTINDFEKIKQFYIDAEYLTFYTKVKFEVDHIIPLQGKYVSGLHVPNNLQIITGEENNKKNNKFEDLNG